MAVVDELVAKLGFKAEGLGDLKKFDDGLKKASDGVKKFGDRLNKNDKLNKIAGVVIPKFTQSLRASVPEAAKMAWEVGRITGGMGALALGGTAVAGVLYKMAQAFVRVRGEAAGLRREMQLNAKGDKTTIGSIDKLQKGFDAIGGKALDGKAKEFVSGIAGKVNDAILGKDYSKFKKAGVSVLDERGNQRDSTAVSIDILAKFANMWKQAQDSRREARTFGLTGDKKKEAAALGRANKSEIDARQFAKDWGVEGPLMAAMQDLKNGAAEFFQKMEKFNRDNPGLTQEDEDQKKRIAEKWAEFDNMAGLFGNALGRSADKLTEDILPAITDFGKGLLKAGKFFGWVPETKGEVEDRKADEVAADKRKSAIEAGSPEIKKALALAEQTTPQGALGDAQSFIAHLFGLGGDREKALARLHVAANSYQRNKAEALNVAGSDVSPEDRKFYGKFLSDSIAELVAAFKDVEKAISPAANGAKVVNDAQKKVEQKNENFGNDQRTISVTNNVNVAVPALAGVANAAASAVGRQLSASELVKNSNANTSIPAAP